MDISLKLCGVEDLDTLVNCLSEPTTKRLPR